MPIINPNSDRIGEIGATTARAPQSVGAAAPPPLQAAAPAAQAEQQEAVEDQLDIPFEDTTPDAGDPELTLGGEQAQTIEGRRQLLAAEDGSEVAEDEELQAAALPQDGEQQELDLEGVEDDPPAPTMEEEMEEVRRSFEQTLSNAPNTMAGSRNSSGIFSITDGLASVPIGGLGGPSSGARAEAPRDGSAPPHGAAPRDGSAPRDTAPSWRERLFGPRTEGPSRAQGPSWSERLFGGGGSNAMGWMGAAMLGLTAMSAFAPMMFGMPMMSGMMMPGMGLGMGLLSMTSMLVPMMSMMSIQMMMAQNSMPPTMANMMPHAMGPMPYQPPMQNPWTQQQPNAPQPQPTPAPAAGQRFPESTLAQGAIVDLTPEQKAKLETLSPPRQQQFVQLWQNLQKQELTLPGRPDRVNVNAALSRLLEQDKLDVKDTAGNDLLSNLSAMSQQQTAPGLDAKQLTAQAIAHVSDPAWTMNQGTPATQSAAAVEYQMVRKNPAEYVRVASGLVGQHGVSSLASGMVVARVPDSIQQDGSARTSLNRVMQSAFMHLAGAATTGMAYSNVSGSFEHPSTAGWNPFRNFGQPQGLDPVQSQMLASMVLSDPVQQSAPQQAAPVQQQAPPVQPRAAAQPQAAPQQAAPQPQAPPQSQAAPQQPAAPVPAQAQPAAATVSAAVDDVADAAPQAEQRPAQETPAETPSVGKTGRAKKTKGKRAAPKKAGAKKPRVSHVAPNAASKAKQAPPLEVLQQTSDLEDTEFLTQSLYGNKIWDSTVKSYGNRVDMTLPNGDKTYVMQSVGRDGSQNNQLTIQVERDGKLHASDVRIQIDGKVSDKEKVLAGIVERVKGAPSETYVGKTVIVTEHGEKIVQYSGENDYQQRLNDRARISSEARGKSSQIDMEMPSGSTVKVVSNTGANESQVSMLRFDNGLEVPVYIDGKARDATPSTFILNAVAKAAEKNPEAYRGTAILATEKGLQWVEPYKAPPPPPPREPAVRNEGRERGEPVVERFFEGGGGGFRG